MFMSQDWERIRAAYPESEDILKFLHDLPHHHPAFEVRLGKGNAHVTFSAYPRHGRRKLHLYNVCPYDEHVYFQPDKFGELLGEGGADWLSRRLIEAFGNNIREGKRAFYYIIDLVDVDKRRNEMASLVDDVGNQLIR
jgi:hypothetical protein